MRAIVHWSLDFVYGWTRASSPRHAHTTHACFSLPFSVFVVTLGCCLLPCQQAAARARRVVGRERGAARHAPAAGVAPGLGRRLAPRHAWRPVPRPAAGVLSALLRALGGCGGGAHLPPLDPQRVLGLAPPGAAAAPGLGHGRRLWGGPGHAGARKQATSLFPPLCKFTTLSQALLLCLRARARALQHTLALALRFWICLLFLIKNSLYIFRRRCFWVTCGSRWPTLPGNW